MRTVFFGRSRQKVRRVFCAAAAGFLVLISVLCIRYPNLPKVIVYKAFREYMRVSLNWKVYSWSEIESENFTIRFRPGDATAARLVLDTAEEIYQPVSCALEYHQSWKIPIIVYSDTISLNRSFGWAADESAMGVYWSGTIRVLSPDYWITGSEKSARFKSEGPVAHEYAHFVVDYIANGNYPRWLTEGIAQQVERSVMGYEMALTGSEEIYPLSEMDSRFDLLPNQSAAYHQSLAMTDYLTDNFGKDALDKILRELGRGASINKAFEKTIGISVNEFEKRFNDQRI